MTKQQIALKNDRQCVVLGRTADKTHTPESSGECHEQAKYHKKTRVAKVQKKEKRFSLVLDNSFSWLLHTHILLPVVHSFLSRSLSLSARLRRSSSGRFAPIRSSNRSFSRALVPPIAFLSWDAWGVGIFVEGAHRRERGPCWVTVSTRSGGRAQGSQLTHTRATTILHTILAQVRVKGELVRRGWLVSACPWVYNIIFTF